MSITELTEQVKTNLEHGKKVVMENFEHGKKVVMDNLEQGKKAVIDNLGYGKELVESGIEGANEARRTVLESEETANIIAVAAEKSWQVASFGVLAGAVVGALTDDRKPVRGVIVGGILGALIGFGGSFAWRTRPLTVAMARQAGKRIGNTRDRHWLDQHPINYG